MCCTDYPRFITVQVCAELDFYNFVICKQKKSRSNKIPLHRMQILASVYKWEIKLLFMIQFIYFYLRGNNNTEMTEEL